MSVLDFCCKGNQSLFIFLYGCKQKETSKSLGMNEVVGIGIFVSMPRVDIEWKNNGCIMKVLKKKSSLRTTVEPHYNEGQGSARMFYHALHQELLATK